MREFVRRDTIGCSAAEFEELLLSASFKEAAALAAGKFNIVVTPWEVAPGEGGSVVRRRLTDYDQHTNAPKALQSFFGGDKPPHVTEKSWYKANPDGSLVIGTAMMLSGLPYAEHFKIQSDQTVRPVNADSCVLEIQAQVEFTTGYFGLPSLVEAQLIKEAEISHSAWTGVCAKFLTEQLAAHRRAKAERAANPGPDGDAASSETGVFGDVQSEHDTAPLSSVQPAVAAPSAAAAAEAGPLTLSLTVKRTQILVPAGFPPIPVAAMAVLGYVVARSVLFASPQHADLRAPSTTTRLGMVALALWAIRRLRAKPRVTGNKDVMSTARVSSPDELERVAAKIFGVGTAENRPLAPSERKDLLELMNSAATRSAPVLVHATSGTSALVAQVVLLGLIVRLRRIIF